MRCPTCAAGLQAFETTAGRVLRCEDGHGTSINLSVLRRRFDETVALWRTASRQPKGTRPCPSCACPMRAFAWQGADEQLELDACSTCQLVWFDAAEIEALRIRLVERTPGTAREWSPPLAGGRVAVGSKRESSLLEQRIENVVDGLDLFGLLDFFDF